MFVTLSLVIGIVGVLCVGFKLYLKKIDRIWIDQGVKFIKRGDVVPFNNLFTQKISFTEFDERIYKRAGDVKYFGYVELTAPVFYVKDVELIKQITIKDFDHFVDRRILNLNKDEAIFGRMLTNVTGKEWKDLRAVMSPTFSTGKIKRMFDLFNQCGDGLTKFLKDKRKKSDVFDFQDAFGRFTMSAIAAIAFGQTTDAFEEDSTFRKMAKQINSFPAIRFFKLIMLMVFPKISKAIRISIIEKKSTKFFAKIIEQNIKQRRAEEDKAGKHNDFLQLLLEAQAGRLKMEENELETFEKDTLLKDESQGDKQSSHILDDITILAQSVLFFIAGSDTLESALTFIAYELALNPDVQEKLANEVHEALENNNGVLTYQVLNGMEYLDMVVCESMRLHPPAFATERQCTKEYVISGTKVVIPRTTRVIIPIRQIHHDPKHYQDPMKFNPENFSSQSKAKRHPYAYLPFGQGPRNCIAMRFAIIEAKVAIAHLVHNFKIEPCEKTQIPFKASTKSGTLKPMDGMPLKYQVRNWSL